MFLLAPLTDRMVDDSKKIVEFAKKSKDLKFIVKLSGIKPETPSFILGQLHLAIENDIKSSGIPWAMLRPNSFHQNIGKKKMGKKYGIFWEFSGNFLGIFGIYILIRSFLWASN